MRKKAAAIMLGSVAVFMSGTASAFCSAPPPKVCSAFFQADVVVRGKVLSVRRGADWIRYRIAVNKTFKGQQLKVRSFDTGNDSGRLELDVGGEYVLFAYRSDNRLLVGCDEELLSMSAKVAAVSQEIERIKISKPKFATIEGQVLSVDFTSPLPGVTITAIGADGIQRTVSKSDGLFLMRVPPGLYRITVDPKVAHQTIYSQIYVNPLSLHLSPGQCAQLQYRATN